MLIKDYWVEQKSFCLLRSENGFEPASTSSSSWWWWPPRCGLSTRRSRGGPRQSRRDESVEKRRDRKRRCDSNVASRCPIFRASSVKPKLLHFEDRLLLDNLEQLWFSFSVITTINPRIYNSDKHSYSDTFSEMSDCVGCLKTICIPK